MRMHAFDKEEKYMPVFGVPIENLWVYTASGSLGVAEGREIDESSSGEVMLGSLFKDWNIFENQVSNKDLQDALLKHCETSYNQLKYLENESDGYNS